MQSIMVQNNGINAHPVFMRKYRGFTTTGDLHLSKVKTTVKRSIVRVGDMTHTQKVGRSVYSFFRGLAISIKGTLKEMR